MPPKGVPGPIRVHPHNKAAKKKLVLEAIAKGETQTGAAAKVEVAPRTIRKWRQEDEKFAVAYLDALDQKVDVYVKTFWDWINDPNFPPHERVIALMFLTKQMDPSFRENAKIEHALAPGLAHSLTKLAKLAESE